MGKAAVQVLLMFAEELPQNAVKDIYFHKSCLELPQQIFHPFHPYHPLTLLKRSDISESYSYFDKLFMNNESFCNACRKLILPFTCGQQNSQSIAYIYEDYKCDFLLHAECSTLMLPAITYEGDGHLLQFRDHNIEKNKLDCSVSRYKICESYSFTCLYCDLNLHLTCGPLPCTIKIKCHLHPLVLTNSPLQEEEGEEEEDKAYKLYCDACEEERDPLLPIYHCAECHYVAELKCVISRVT